MITLPENTEIEKKVLQDNIFCIIFMGWDKPIDSKDVLDLFLYFFSETGFNSSFWWAKGMDGRNVSGKKKILNSSEHEYYDVSLRHGRKELRGTWDVLCRFYDGNYSDELTNGLNYPYLQMAASLELIKDRRAVLQKFFDFISSHANFGYGYSFCAPYGENIETYGPGMAASGVTCEEFEDRFS